MPKAQSPIIGSCECPSCGNQTPVKVNKNGNVFVNCGHIIIPEKGERCGYRCTYGRIASKEMIKQYNGVKDNDKTDQGHKENQQREPAGNEPNRTRPEPSGNEPTGSQPEPRPEPARGNEYELASW